MNLNIAWNDYACYVDAMFYVIVISWAQGIYGIYCTEARGGEVARGLSAINVMHTDLTILYPVGTATTAKSS